MRIRVQFRNGTYMAKVDGSAHSASCTAGPLQAATRAAEKALDASVGTLQVKLVGGNSDTSWYDATRLCDVPQGNAGKTFEQLFQAVFNE